jgi:hypothetical protein
MNYPVKVYEEKISCRDCINGNMSWNHCKKIGCIKTKEKFNNIKVHYVTGTKFKRKSIIIN